jgi:aminopeptidase N
MLLTALILLQAPLAARADSIPPRHNALHHDVLIVLGDTGSHILGVMTTTWRLTSSDPVEVQLDSAFRVVRVLTDGVGELRMSRITFARNPDGGVYIPHKKEAGDTLRTAIRYHGPVRDGLVIRTDSSGRRTVFADNWPDRAHRWLPLEDQPGDKATVDFHVEAPPGVEVIASGVRQKVDTLPRGRRVWHFSMRQPIPPYGMVIGAGPLLTTTLPDAACDVKCVPQAVVTFAEDSAWAVDGPFRRTTDMLDFFSRLIGPFPYDRLSQVQSTTRYGGMENPTAIFYDADAYRGRSLRELTVAHETAHQWFGDAVTPDDWHHLWLSEGFATYYAALWLRHADGDSAFRAVMARARGQVAGSDATRRPILDTLATDLMGLLNSNNYPKGAWVLHTLRGLMGDSAYHAGIREWYRAYRDSSALSSDFSIVMSRAAGRDLEWYFRQALLQPGFPRLHLVWRHQGRRLTIRVHQVQDPAWGLFRLPGLVLSIDGREERIDVDGRETVVAIDGVARRPSRVLLDPGDWWLLQQSVTEER